MASYPPALQIQILSLQITTTVAKSVVQKPEKRTQKNSLENHANSSSNAHYYQQCESPLSLSLSLSLSLQRLNRHLTT